MRERISDDIEGIIEGSKFSSRIELSEVGGYPDDTDEIIYTGHGGQD